MGLTCVLTATFLIFSETTSMQRSLLLGSVGVWTLGIAVAAWLILGAHVGWVITCFSRWLPSRAKNILSRISEECEAYRGQAALLLGCWFLSVATHLLTACVYYCTALAVGADAAAIGDVLFASSLQILATVLSPLTIAGEGVREAVQALLLAHRLGLPQSVLSAALGFWAAEALTLVGGVVWWVRGTSYRPTLVATKQGRID